MDGGPLPLDQVYRKAVVGRFASVRGRGGLSMYRLFLIGAKIAGIFLIVDGAIEAGVLVSSNRGAYGPQIAFACFLHLFAGTLLAFWTGFVAKAVRIREDFEGETPSISYRSALEVGMVLIALFELLRLLPRVAMHWNDLSALIAQVRTPADLISPESVGVLAAVLLL